MNDRIFPSIAWALADCLQIEGGSKCMPADKME